MSLLEVFCKVAPILSILPISPHVRNLYSRRSTRPVRPTSAVVVSGQWMSFEVSKGASEFIW